MCGEITKLLKIFIFIWKLLGAAPPPSCRRSLRGEQICLDPRLEAAVVPTHRRHSDQVSGPNSPVTYTCCMRSRGFVIRQVFCFWDCITMTINQERQNIKGMLNIWIEPTGICVYAASRASQLSQGSVRISKDPE